MALRLSRDITGRALGNSRMEVSSNELRKAVEAQHGGAATLVTKLPVKEVFQGKTVWECVVHMFNLEGNPRATRAYAWSLPAEEGSDQRRIFDQFDLGGIRPPPFAVKAPLPAEPGAADCLTLRPIPRASPAVGVAFPAAARSGG